MQHAQLPATAARQVRLIEQPDGYLSQHDPVTVGQVYDVLGSMGSCLVISTDVAGQTASIWRGRFQAVS